MLEIARRVGVARGTVQARLRKLEERGVITGYGPEVEPGKMGYPIAPFVFVELNQGRLTEAVEAAREVPEVLEVDAVSWQQDLICRVVARDTEHLHGFLNLGRDHPAVAEALELIAETVGRARTRP